MFDQIWWFCALTLFAGCIIQTSMGFGLAVLAAPIIVMLRPEWAPIILTMVSLILSILNAWGLRHAIHWQSMSVAMITRIPGTILGAWVLTIVAIQALQLMIAIMVLLAILITAFTKPFETSPRRMAIAGLLSGFMGTTTAIGGPPMALLMQHGNGDTIRSNLAVYFVFGCIVALISYQMIGLLSDEIWVAGLSFIPVTVAGYGMGIYARQWVDSRFRPILLVLCSISASAALFGAIH